MSKEENSVIKIVGYVCMGISFVGFGLNGLLISKHMTKNFPLGVFYVIGDPYFYLFLAITAVPFGIMFLIESKLNK